MASLAFGRTGASAPGAGGARRRGTVGGDRAPGAATSDHRQENSRSPSQDNQQRARTAADAVAPPAGCSALPLRPTTRTVRSRGPHWRARTTFALLPDPSQRSADRAGFAGGSHPAGAHDAAKRSAAGDQAGKAGAARPVVLC